MIHLRPSLDCVQIFVCLGTLQLRHRKGEMIIPVGRPWNFLYSSRSLGVRFFNFASRSFVFLAAISLSNLTFQARKDSRVTGVPRVFASSALTRMMLKGAPDVKQEGGPPLAPGVPSRLPGGAHFLHETERVRPIVPEGEKQG